MDDHHRHDDRSLRDTGESPARSQTGSSHHRETIAEGSESVAIGNDVEGSTVILCYGPTHPSALSFGPSNSAISLSHFGTLKLLDHMKSAQMDPEKLRC